MAGSRGFRDLDWRYRALSKVGVLLEHISALGGFKERVSAQLLRLRIRYASR